MIYSQFVNWYLAAGGRHHCISDLAVKRWHQTAEARRIAAAGVRLHVSFHPARALLPHSPPELSASPCPSSSWRAPFTRLSIVADAHSNIHQTQHKHRWQSCGDAAAASLLRPSPRHGDTRHPRHLPGNPAAMGGHHQGG